MNREYPQMRPDRHWERRAFSLAVITGLTGLVVVVGLVALVWEAVKVVVRNLG